MMSGQATNLALVVTFSRIISPSPSLSGMEQEKGDVLITQAFPHSRER